MPKSTVCYSVAALLPLHNDYATCRYSLHCIFFVKVAPHSPLEYHVKVDGIVTVLMIAATAVGCQSLKRSKDSSVTSARNAQPAYGQHYANASQMADAQAVATASAQIDQAFAAATSGSPRIPSADEAYSSSRRPRIDPGPSTCSSGCCSQ